MPSLPRVRYISSKPLANDYFEIIDFKGINMLFSFVCGCFREIIFFLLLY